MIKYLKDCIRELSSNEPDYMKDYYRCRLDGRYAMTARYPESDATREAVHAIYAAYNIADDIRALNDNEDGDDYDGTEKYEELYDAFYEALETAEELVDALDEE